MAEHLRGWVHSQIDTYELFFWRTRGGIEVDFVLYGLDLFLAIEVKNSKKMSSQDLEGV